ncbi:MAG TPA: ribosome silencing factor [Gemmatimonadaceae bacterium]|jgi:ribosome-associated protein|nr:ribosome silencing factor [Gemmatimonadaceae bacterium]
MSKTKQTEKNQSAISGEQIARRIAELLDDKKGVDIVALDVRGLANFADYFVFATGRSDRQTKALHDAIREGMKADPEMLPVHTEGERERRWILLDYGDVIAHVMIPEVREYYRLEQLWSDAPRLELDLSPQEAIAENDAA